MHYLSINEQEVSQVSAFDRGLAYGDGFFTTARITAGKVMLLDAHIDRLRKSSVQLCIEPIDFEQLARHLVQVASSFTSGVLKVLISAGSGGRGYGRPEKLFPTVIVSVHDIPEHYQLWREQGINVGLAKTRLGLNPALSGLKHLNRLEQVLVRKELDQCDYDDLIVANIRDEAIEATSANLYWRIDQQWFTSDISQSGVNGIIRQFLLSQDHSIRVVNENVEQLAQASAMFITNAILGVVPIRAYLDRQLTIASDHYDQLLSQVNC